MGKICRAIPLYFDSEAGVGNIRKRPNPLNLEDLFVLKRGAFMEITSYSATTDVEFYIFANSQFEPMIRSIISKRVSAIAVIAIFICTMGFHLLVLAGIVPYTIVWGGRLTSREEMVTFEVFSLLINGLMLTVVLISAGYIRVKINASLLRFILWTMATLFFLNTIGNIFSTNRLETIIFTPLTFILALLCVRLAIEID